MNIAYFIGSRAQRRTGFEQFYVNRSEEGKITHAWGPFYSREEAEACIAHQRYLDGQASLEARQLQWPPHQDMGPVY
jgi:hypothetical protein